MREALEQGQSYTWTVADGGNLASMRKAIKHGQTLTISPIHDPAEIRVGDMVLVKWHAGDIFHLVGEIGDDRYLIVNSLGGENGWVTVDKIMGRVTSVVEPEPRPDVPALLEMLDSAFRAMIASDQPLEPDARCLLSVIGDLRWYGERLGPQRWDLRPRDNKWSFQQNLWWLVKQARNRTAPVPDRLLYFTDLGKQITGLSAEIVNILDYNDPLK
jgi:hypothetical protein